MKVQLLSDLHIEFHQDRGVAWIDALDPSDVDVLILAGDIAEVKDGLLSDVLEVFTDRYPQVVFVPGNHEYYGSSLGACHEVFESLGQRIANLHVLRRSSVEIVGKRFVGASLWFTQREDEEHSQLENRLNDFHKIAGGFRSWVYDEAQRDASYLHQAVQPGDIVVTHHIPSLRGVAPKWKGVVDGFGRFFVHALPETLVRRARLWCHGHGHDSVRSDFENHTLVANPFGYLGVEENPDFNPRLTFEI
ncbi:MAG: metallophosphoesterase [Myxococcota bacterium]|nr:metallophosphoesterase [Myxococcota bacterium]